MDTPINSSEMSIHDRLDNIETVINAGSGIAGGIAGLIDKLRHHVPTPATTENASTGDTPSHDDVLSRTAFTAAMVQQAKDFGVAIEDVRTRLKAVEDVNAEIISTLEAISKPAPQS